jgi:hypothetical protein
MVWLESVSSASVCYWFYIMFVVNCVVALIMVVRIIVLIAYTRPGLLIGSASFFITLLAVVVPIINGAFFYTLCDRSIGSGVDPNKFIYGY